MEAKELMIWDWVYGLSHTPRKVQGLRDYNEENVVVAGHWVNCNQLAPIPLTIEIIFTNNLPGNIGFFVSNENDAEHPDGYYLEVYGMGIYGLRYVHELQHALRLCGLNDLADNFKV